MIATTQGHMELNMHVYSVDLDGNLLVLQGMKTDGRSTTTTTTMQQASIPRTPVREDCRTRL